MLSGIFRLALLVVNVGQIQCWTVENDGFGNRIGSMGISQSSSDGRKNAKRIFNRFAEDRKLPNLDNIQESVFCKVPLIQAFADYLVNVYKKDDGELLSLNGVLTNLSHVMTLAKERFKLDDGSFPTFFNVLGGKQDSPSNWYRDLRKAVERIIQRRCIENGSPIIDKATPISRVAIKEFCFAHLRMDTPGTIKS
jgi:hypothetical protein